MSNYSEGLYPIIDLHTCIQGEGKYAGIPHILIRLSGCNLRCQFKDNICDTPYSSWFPEEGKYSLEDVEKIIKTNPQINHSFITGGEPFLYPSFTRSLIQMSKENYHFVAAETNGTLFEDLPFDFVTISPKLTNSVPVDGKIFKDAHGNDFQVSKNDRVKHERQRLKPDILKMFIERYEYQFKFVIQDQTDIEEVNELVKTLEVPSGKVYLMPEGITNEQIQAKRIWLIEKCIELGYNFSDRLHIIAYGNKRDA